MAAAEPQRQASAIGSQDTTFSRLVETVSSEARALPTRRRCLGAIAVHLASQALVGHGGRATVAAESTSESSLHVSSTERITGMLLGGLIGDALGGAPEFNSSEFARARMPNTRAWSDERRVNSQDLHQLANTLRLYGYEKLRPSTAPYGPWVANAPAGTLTDDSRHKIILMRAIEQAARAKQPLDRHEIARQLIRFRPRVDATMSPATQLLCEEGLREYRFASRWLLGERGTTSALPLERLWGGISNCSGQMMFPPLAAVFAGDPVAAYRATYALDFIDAPAARDICSALNAGLAAALDPKLDKQDSRTRWDAFFSAMQRTDPLQLSKVPFAGRPLSKWLTLADKLVSESDGRPRTLFERLERDGKPVYWWDAHFTLLVPVTILKFCRYDGLAALHLTLDFGHDTDSYAQVLGCLVGAIDGVRRFPGPIRAQVESRLAEEYGESVDTWRTTLETLRVRWQRGNAVCAAIS